MHAPHPGALSGAKGTRLRAICSHPLRGGLTSGRTPTKESGCTHRTYGAEDLYPVLLHWARFVSRPDQGVGMHKSRLWRLCGRPT